MKKIIFGFMLLLSLPAFGGDDYRVGGTPGKLYDMQGVEIAVYGLDGRLQAQHVYLAQILENAHRGDVQRGENADDWYDADGNLVATPRVQDVQMAPIVAQVQPHAAEPAAPSESGESGFFAYYLERPVETASQPSQGVSVFGGPRSEAMGAADFSASGGLSALILPDSTGFPVDAASSALPSATAQVPAPAELAQAAVMHPDTPSQVLAALALGQPAPAESETSEQPKNATSVGTKSSKKDEKKARRAALVASRGMSSQEVAERMASSAAAREAARAAAVAPRSPASQGAFTRDYPRYVSDTRNSPLRRGVREASALTPYLHRMYRAGFPKGSDSPMRRRSVVSRKRKSGAVDEDAVKLAREECRPREGWSRTIEMDGRTIDQRDELFDPLYICRTGDYADGRTNLQRMLHGNAPIGPGDEPINLHHWLQRDPGPLGEVSALLHEREDCVLHFKADDGVGMGEQRRIFDEFRWRYWQQRARDIMARLHMPLPPSQPFALAAASASVSSLLPPAVAEAGPSSQAAAGMLPAPSVQAAFVASAPSLSVLSLGLRPAEVGADSGPVAQAARGVPAVSTSTSSLLPPVAAQPQVAAAAAPVREELPQTLGPTAPAATTDAVASTSPTLLAAIFAVMSLTGARRGSRLP